MVCVSGGVVLVIVGCAMSMYDSLNTGKQIESSFLILWVVVHGRF